MNIKHFTCEYLLKGKDLDFKLSGHGLGTRVIVYRKLFFLEYNTFKQAFCMI